MKRIVSIIITACILLSLLTVLTSAEGTKQKTPIEAKITNVYDGRDGIVSMTFDDGYYQTALLLQELFEQYDLYGSLMMTSESANGHQPNYAKPNAWNELFDKGRLEPQNHSATHLNLAASKDPSNQNTETFKSEILDSKITLEGYFPEYDIITYAIPHGSMSNAALEYAAQYYYAVRSTAQGVQTLDPGFGTSKGDWYYMYSPVVMRDGFTEETQWNYIKTAIDTAANGWYVPIIHRVGDVDLTDLPLEMAHKMFAYISELNKAGKVWVTTYSSAVKYVRERQNSSVSAWEENGNIHVQITMSETTEDGKELPLDIFDQPLTVKVPVPNYYGSVYYTTGGVEYIAVPFAEGAQSYVYVNLIPDGTDVKLRLTSTHAYGDWEKSTEENHKRFCIDCGLIDYSEHTFNEGVVTTPSTHTKHGILTCECTACGEDTEMPAPLDPEHIFNRKLTNPKYLAEEANCQHGKLFYIVCTCGAVSTQTFENGEKGDHDFTEWTVTVDPTKETEGAKTRSCRFGCGYTEDEAIPRISDDPEPPDGGESYLIPIIIAGALALLVGGAAASFMVISKRKKKQG